MNSAGQNHKMDRPLNKAKQHHYVPRSYLERFADAKGFLHVFDRTTNTFRRQRPKEVMKINAYYRQQWAPVGIDPNILEVKLGEWLEPEAKGVIGKLIEDPELLTEGDLANLLTFLELQRIRVPRQAEVAKTLMRAALLNSLPDSAVEVITSGAVKLTIKDAARFDYMRMMIGNLTPWFARMEWEIFTAEDGAAFIATDSPVSFYNASIPPPAEAGIGLIGTMVFYPISSQHVLLMRHPEYRQAATESRLTELPDAKHVDGHIPITRGEVWSHEVVNNFNWKMMQLSSRLIVANSQAVLERCINK